MGSELAGSLQYGLGMRFQLRGLSLREAASNHRLDQRHSLADRNV